MNLSIIAPTLTMSSREIADLVKQRHDNVKRTIETLGNKGVISLPQFEEVPNDGPGPKAIGVYLVGKRDSLIVVAQLCPEFTAAMVDRWQELEATQQPQVSDPRTAALIESLVRFDQLEQQQKVLQAQTAALTNRLDQIETAQTHFTVVGYMNTVAHKSVPLTEASTIGRRATKLCKERDLDIGSVPDPRFGRANTYPKHILDETLGDIVAEMT